MQWSRYEIFSVVSGLIMVAAGLLVTMPGRDRLVYIGGCAALARDGLYVGGQDSGTFFFPAAIFAVPVAADESIRRSGDPERVVALEAADVAVLKVQPLGGVAACLELAERLGLPVVVSSALETSVGLAAGLALAAALPELPDDCGLNTSRLLVDDVVDDPLVAVDGWMEVRRPVPTPARLRRLAADPATTAEWFRRRDLTARLAG